MKSSQALAQSVFGNLIALGKLNVLRDMRDDEGRPLFSDSASAPLRAELEHSVRYLGERRNSQTSVDVLFSSPNYKVAVECKLTETDIGTCSRPLIDETKSNYQTSYCQVES